MITEQKVIPKLNVTILHLLKILMSKVLLHLGNVCIRYGIFHHCHMKGLNFRSLLQCTLGKQVFIRHFFEDRIKIISKYTIS